MPGNIIVNNILHANLNGKSITGYGEAGLQNIFNNWMDEGDPGFMDDTIPADTRNPALPDFRLKPESPCIDRGVFLANITDVSATGMSFTINDAGFFYDGWGIPGEVGDTIQLEGQVTTAVIKAVDYSQNRITVDSPVSWTQGQGVSLAYSGTSPDLGACEYQGK